jgi:hypothetical protein
MHNPFALSKRRLHKCGTQGCKTCALRMQLWLKHKLQQRTHILLAPNMPATPIMVAHGVSINIPTSPQPVVFSQPRNNSYRVLNAAKAFSYITSNTTTQRKVTRDKASAAAVAFNACRKPSVKLEHCSIRNLRVSRLIKRSLCSADQPHQTSRAMLCAASLQHSTL